MGLFKNKRGVDLVLLQRTKFWNDVEQIIELDPDTHYKLVEYIYEAVSDARIGEIDKLGAEIQKMNLVPQVLNFLSHRRSLLVTYKGLKNGSKRGSKTQESSWSVAQPNLHENHFHQEATNSQAQAGATQQDKGA